MNTYHKWVWYKNFLICFIEFMARGINSMMPQFLYMTNHYISATILILSTVICIRLTHLITGDQITEMENKREIKGPLMPLTNPFRVREVMRWEYIRWSRQMIHVSSCRGRGYTPKISDYLNRVAAGGKRVFHLNLAICSILCTGVTHTT